MSQYAQNTSVSVEKSKGEIERTLMRYGATGFMYGWQDDGKDTMFAVVAFHMSDRRVKFLLPMPSKNAEEFWHTPSRGTRRSALDALRQWEQACRQRWRALALVIKAKLEAVESGITTFEQEFMAHILLPDGQTVGQYMTPQIENAYQTGKMPALLPYTENPNG